MSLRKVFGEWQEYQGQSNVENGVGIGYLPGSSRTEQLCKTLNHYRKRRNPCYDE